MSDHLLNDQIRSCLETLASQGAAYAFFLRQGADSPFYQASAERFPSASILKLPILLAWVHLERRGEVDSNALCNLDSEPEVHGAGFSWLLRQRRLPWHDVLLLMMALSDNLCSNLVIQQVGMARLNQVFRDDLGLSGTELQRRFMDFEARREGRENWITASDCTRLFDLFAALTPAEKAWVEPMLRACQHSALLMRCIPEEAHVRFYHKTGTNTGILHDWGYTATRQVYLLTQGVQDEIAAAEIFGEIGRLALLEG
ncbi:MAG TPA: serine hydrolase [Anaerolineaceae bacterium]